MTGDAKLLPIIRKANETRFDLQIAGIEIEAFSVFPGGVSDD